MLILWGKMKAPELSFSQSEGKIRMFYLGQKGKKGQLIVFEH